MATFRRRGDKWIAEVCVNGVRRSKTHDSKQKARFWAAEKEAELSIMACGVSPTHTLGDVFERYAEEVSDKKKGARWEVVRLRMFGRDEISRIKLADLRREHFEAWIDLRLKSVKASSVNRELNLISHCLTQARRWRLMKDNPMNDLKRPKNPPPRDRRISPGEIEILLVSLGYDERTEIMLQRQRVAVAVLFALETAMRAGEICSLTPDNIDEAARTAFLPDTKNGLPRYVPLSQEALRLLNKLKPWVAPVFNLDSGTLSTLFKNAVKNCGIENLTFHDTRHEAITRLAQKLDVLDLARTVGHSDIRQLSTYYNKSAADIAKQL